MKASCLRRRISLAIVISIFALVLSGLGSTYASASSSGSKPPSSCDSNGWDFCPVKLPKGDVWKVLSVSRTCAHPAQVFAKLEIKYPPGWPLDLAVQVPAPGSNYGGTAGSGVTFTTTRTIYRNILTPPMSSVPKEPISNSRLKLGWQISSLSGAQVNGNLWLNALHCKA